MGIKHLGPKTEKELRTSLVNLSPFEMIKMGCQEGLLWLVKEAVEKKKISPAVNNNCPLLWASQSGHLDIVKYLMNFDSVDPSDLESVALRSAIYYGHIEIVKLFLDDGRANPADHNFDVIKDVIRNNPNTVPKENILRLLFKDKRFVDAFKEYTRERPISIKDKTRIYKINNFNF